MAQSGIYEIRLEGHLTGDWSNWFEGLSISNDPGRGMVLRGPIVDQAALIGLLAKVQAMNLTLTSVSRLPTSGESDKGKSGGGGHGSGGAQRSLGAAKSNEREGDRNET